MKRGILSGVLLFLVFVSFSQASQCPSTTQIENKLKKVFPRARNLKVLKISPAPLPGFCEAVMGSPDRPFKNVIYVDQKGKYALLGQLVNLETGENITRKRMMDLSRLSPAQVQRLEKFVAFTAGEGPKLVYLVTDPDCPFCKKLEKTLAQFIKEGKLTVKVIFMPLERLHPKAKEKCIAIICDKKGFDALLAGYSSSNQCPEGKAKVEAAQKYLFSLGIRGTPALILPDGRIIRGALPKEKLAKILGL